MKILLALLLSGVGWAQYAPSASGSTVAAAEINSKPAIRSGSGGPSALTCTTGKDFYIDTTNIIGYYCYATNTWSRFAVWGTIGGTLSNQADLVTALNQQQPIVSFRAVCQSTLGGSNFDINSSVGTPATQSNCDNSGLDGNVQFASGATNHVQGKFYLSSKFVDPLSATIVDWDSSAVTGAVTFGIAWQCVGINGVASTGGYGSYTTWPSSTVSSTSYGRNATGALSLTTGCSTNSMFYFDIELTSGNNTLGAGANLKRLNFSGSGIGQ